MQDNTKSPKTKSSLSKDTSISAKLINKLKRLNIKHLEQILIYPKQFKKTIINLSILSLISGTLSVATAYITKFLVDSVVETPKESFLPILLVIGVVFILELVITSSFEYFKLLYRTKEYNKLQSQVIDRCLKKEWLSIGHFQTGELLTRVNNDTQRIIDFWLNSFPDVLGLTMRFALAFALLWQFDPLLATVSFIIAPITIVLSYPISSRLKSAQRDMIEAESSLQSHVAELLQNLTLIKVFSHATQSLNSVKEKQAKVYQTTRKRALVMLLSQSILILGYTTGHFLGLAFGAFRLSQNLITFGTFSALIQLIAQIQGPLTQLSKTIPRFIVSMASSDRLTAFSNLPEEIETTDHTSLSDFKKITFSDVNFEYITDQKLFHSFNTEIHKGDRIAIIGPSGSGKTTFSRLLLSFLKPAKGFINIHLEDGSHTLNTTRSRSLYAYVPQDNVLFSGTILENLLLADSNATEEAITEVLDIACAQEFITNLQDGLNTHVGERGIGLSQGQIQRLCIARALLYKKPILILDEATSALDTNTEQAIIKNLNAYDQSLTIIAITHRSSILEICNKEIKL